MKVNKGPLLNMDYYFPNVVHIVEAIFQRHGKRQLVLGCPRNLVNG